MVMEQQSILHYQACQTSFQQPHPNITIFMYPLLCTSDLVPMFTNLLSKIPLRNHSSETPLARAFSLPASLVMPIQENISTILISKVIHIFVWKKQRQLLQSGVIPIKSYLEVVGRKALEITNARIVIHSIFACSLMATLLILYLVRSCTVSRFTRPNIFTPLCIVGEQCAGSSWCRRRERKREK